VRVRRRAKLRREGYEPAHAYQLLKGFVFLHEGYGRPERDDFDAATAQADWADHRDALMAYWCQDPAAWILDLSESHWVQAKPGGLGTRPWAWWTFEAPQPRRLVARWTAEGRVIPLDLDTPPELDVADWPRLWLTQRWRYFYFGMRTPAPGYVEFESEYAYLTRLGLLPPEEHAARETEDDGDPASPDLHDPQWGWLTRRELAGPEASS
jgi:hypothetical protein